MNSTTLTIFDCDGVLVDSEPLANRTMIKCLQDEGFDVDEAYAEKYFHGVSNRDCLVTIAAHFNRKVSNHFEERLSLMVTEEIKNTLQPIPHIKEALEKLDYPRCVASGSEPDKIELSLYVTGLRKYFTNLYSSLEVPRGKPFPDVFLHAAKEMGFRADQCIVIEDSDPGVQAALSAGMKVLLYRPFDLDLPVFNESVIVFDSMKKLPSIIEGILKN